MAVLVDLENLAAEIARQAETQETVESQMALLAEVNA